MQKQPMSGFLYIVIMRNPFSVNNSGNPEPIRTKFYTMSGAQMGRFPGNFGRPRSRVAKMVQKNELFSSGIQRFQNAISQWLICVKFGQ